MEKMKRGSLFKSPASTNRSTAWSTVNAPIFYVFSCLMILPLPFSVEIPNFFMSNAKGILIFGQNLTFFLRIFLYDAYDMKFMQS